MNNDLKDKVMKLDTAREERELKELKKRREKSVIKQTTVESSSGEIVAETEIREIRTSKGVEPDFVKLYINDLMLINDLPTKASNALMELIKLVTFDNKIILNGAIKKDICSRLNIKPQTLNNNLTSFVKKEILYRLDTGIYMPNPYLFARGKWEDIHDLRMIVNYKSNGVKTVELEIDGKSAKEYNETSLEQ